MVDTAGAIERGARREWSLAGTWQARSTRGEGGWRPIAVPGCWEEAGFRFDDAGPVTYRRRFTAPLLRPDGRLWLRFGGVSYACRVVVDGVEVGRHVGAWDAFAVEITDAVRRPGHEAELVVEVEKPASPTAGPDSPTVPGRYPLRETLSGFLPYVWGHMFGGIWQDVTLVETGPVVIESAYVRGDTDGAVVVEADLSGPGTFEIAIEDPDGRDVAVVRSEAERHVRLGIELAGPRAWSPASPARYVARLRVAPDADADAAGDERTMRFGLRSIAVDGSTVMLNGEPIYPRLALSWGWYPDRLTPTPDRDRVRRDMLALRSLGYNGVKVCLWFPPEDYLDVADELGMLVWIELPMWLPHPTAHFRTQVGTEYERLVRQARDHPSVVVYTLGCELDTSVADLLTPLYERVKRLAPDALVRDNSGSGEAYGGRLDEASDFYDHHFYAELPYLRGLLDGFSPRWRTRQPWLFGEFCDLDAFRDPRRLGGSGAPWWTSRDPTVNPQGARWAMDVTGFADAVRDAGYMERVDELVRLSEQQALLHRKHTIELVRSYREVSGYVVTGERDTPISTAGMFDDVGDLRFDPDAFRAFNADTVILLASGRRRAWIAGGDRFAPLDPWSHRAGDEVRLHLVCSHHGRVRSSAESRWSVAFEDGAAGHGTPFASGRETTDVEIAPGDHREVAVVRFDAPLVDSPRRARLEAAVRIGDETSVNSWPLWVYPRDPLSRLHVRVSDPADRLAGLAALLPEPASDAAVLVATRWDDALERHLERGGGAVLLQEANDGPLPADALPFWREAVRVAERHPAWGDFPVEPFPGLQFLAMSTDHAFATAGRSDVRPLLRRVDARTGRVHDYAVELPWGAGRLIATTLRLDGGHGDQPLGVTRSPSALHLLGCWLRWLAS